MRECDDVNAFFVSMRTGPQGTFNPEIDARAALPSRQLDEFHKAFSAVTSAANKIYGSDSDLVKQHKALEKKKKDLQKQYESGKIRFDELQKEMANFPVYNSGAVNTKIIKELGRALKTCNRVTDGIKTLVFALYDRMPGSKDIRADIHAKQTRQKVYWYERGTNHVALMKAPLDHRQAQGKLAKELFEGRTPIFISATLSTESRKGNFEHFKREMGFGRYWGKGAKPIEIKEQSTFNWPSQAAVYFPTGLPQPDYRKDGPRGPSEGTAAYHEAMRKSIADCVRRVDGNCMVLCSNRLQVDQIAKYLMREFGTETEVLNQNREAISRLTLKMKSGVVPKKVLVGAQSLWEGIDLPGEALRGLFITKAPFQVPSHPLVKERSEKWVQISGGTPYFRDVSLPETLSMIRQGAGRLLRSSNEKTEYGIIVFYDHRISSTKAPTYFSQIKEAFPLAGTPVYIDDLPDKVKGFFDERTRRNQDEMAAEPVCEALGPGL